jgi:hypothetical protein
MTNISNGAAISLRLATGEPYGPRIAESRSRPCACSVRGGTSSVPAGLGAPAASATNF